MKTPARMSLMDGVLSVGIPALSVLSWALAHSVRGLSASLTGLENAMILSVEALSILVICWWALGIILGVGYLLKVRSGSLRIRHRDERGTFLLPRYMRNTVLTIGGAALGLSAALAPAQAADAHQNISSPPISAPAQVSASPIVPSVSSAENPSPHASAGSSSTAEPELHQGTPSQTSPFYQPQAPSPPRTSPPYAPSPSETPSAVQPQADHQSLSPFFGGQREGSPPREVIPTTRHHASDGYHVVVAGDSLWSIAHHELGSDASPPEILEYSLRIHAANLEVMGDNPNILYPGQVLTLPDP